MKPVRHPSNTRTLGGPAGWDQFGLPVDDLGITDQVLEGVPCVWSFWEPDAVELAAIAAGSKVVLSIAGRTMPPALLLVEASAAAPATGPAGARTVWRDMATAPKDGTMVRLLVTFDDHATEDQEGPSPTIGANSFKNTGVDEWLFAGWCWTHDHFTQGVGTPVGWLPMLDAAPIEAQAHDDATCKKCGCTDSRACAGGCTWLWVDRAERTGLCSSCVPEISPENVNRDKLGQWWHSALKEWPGDTSYIELINAAGLEDVTVTGDDAPAAVQERLEKQWDGDFSFWELQPPAGDGWFLLGAYDTEDGPVQCWVRPAATTTAEEGGPT